MHFKEVFNKDFSSEGNSYGDEIIRRKNQTRELELCFEAGDMLKPEGTNSAIGDAVVAGSTID